MHKPKLATASFTQPAQAVFDAVLGAVQNGKFTLVALDNDNHRMAFTSGKTPLSWGQEYIADVSASATASASELSLVCGGVDGKPTALLDGWKNGRAGEKVMSTIKDVLAGTTSAPATPTASFGAVPPTA